MNKCREYIDKLYDVWFSYSGSGTVLFIGDSNAQCCSSSIRTRDQLLCKLFADTTIVAVNTLAGCLGAHYSYVSYDGLYNTLIYFIGIPVDLSQCA